MKKLLPVLENRIFQGLVLTAPLAVYAGLIARYAYNFPFLDDYETVIAHALLQPREQVINGFAPHNEHIHLILKFLVSADQWAWGQINLVRLIWYGAGFFLVFHGLLLYRARKSGLERKWLLPLPFFLFQPSYWGTMTWATTALHNFPGLFFAWLAILLWKDRRPHERKAAYLFLILALLTHGFGVALLASLIVWEGYQLWQSRRGTSSRNSMASLAGLLLCLTGWIVFRQSQEISLFSKPVETRDLFAWLHFFSNFTGSCIHFLGSPWINLLALAELAVFAWLLKTGFHRKHPEWACFIVYLFFAAAITTVARVDMGPHQGLASRYRIYSTLLVCFLYLGLCLTYARKGSGLPRVLPSAMAVAFLFYGASLFVNVNNLEKMHDRLVADRNRWSEGQPVREFPVPEHAARILREAEDAGRFNRRSSIHEPAP